MPSISSSDQSMNLTHVAHQSKETLSDKTLNRLSKVFTTHIRAGRVLTDQQRKIVSDSSTNLIDRNISWQDVSLEGIFPEEYGFRIGIRTEADFNRFIDAWEESIATVIRNLNR